MGAKPVAHTFDLTHSPYGSLVHQQRTCTKPTRLFFRRFFLTQKEANQPKPRSTNATNRRAARAVAQHRSTTKQHTKKHTYTYIYPPSRGHTPVCAGGGACVCRDSLGVCRCECCPLQWLRVCPVSRVRVGNGAPSVTDPTGTGSDTPTGARFEPHPAEMRRPDNQRSPTRPHHPAPIPDGDG